MAREMVMMSEKFQVKYKRTFSNVGKYQMSSPNGFKIVSPILNYIKGWSGPN